MRDAKKPSASQRTVASALPSRPLVAVAPTDTVLAAARLMAAANCGSALATSGDTVVGIVTERDFLNKVVAQGLDPAGVHVADVMTKQPVCARQDMPVTHALFTMKELGFRHLPVLDAQRRPLGVFTLRDALPAEMAGADSMMESVIRLTEARD